MPVTMWRLPQIPVKKICVVLAGFVVTATGNAREILQFGVFVLVAITRENNSHTTSHYNGYHDCVVGFSQVSLGIIFVCAVSRAFRYSEITHHSLVIRVTISRNF